jgi:tetratricopeptide (TPR) repeat protein
VDPAAADPVQARFRLFEAAVALLRAAGERAPLFVVLDDLHVADPSSLALLHFVARNLRGLRALVVGTYRDEEARLSSEVGRVLTDVAREGAYLPLPPLDRAGIAALVTGAAGCAPEPALIEALERATEGNPLFLGELLRLLVARGDLGPVARPAAALPIPDTVREVIGRRIARLDADTRATLVSASVVGREFSLALLAAAAGLPASELERQLEEADRAGLVQSPGRGSWRFSHVLVREALYREIDPLARAEAHQRVAAALEASGRGEVVVAEVAHHRLAALPEGDAAAAARAARVAADRAMAMLAFEDAAQLLQRTRQAVQATGSPDPRALCELELLEGMAWMRAGDGARGRAACGAAADEARRLGAGDLLARAALGYGAELMLAQTDPKLVALLQEALVVLPTGAGGWRAQVLARLAATLQPADDVTVPMGMAREAIAMARTLNDPVILRTVLLAGGAALADYAPPAERAPVSEELLGLATAAGDRFQVMRAQSRLVFDYLELGQVMKATRALDGYESVAAEFRQARHIWPGRLMRSMLASAQGLFDEAMRLYDEAVGLAEGDSDLPTPFVLAWCRLGHALESERPSELLAAEEQLLARRTMPGLPAVPASYIHMATATVRARLGDNEAARQQMAQVDIDDDRMFGESEINALLAEPVAHLEDAAAAGKLYQRLRPLSGQVVSYGRAGMSCAGPVDMWLGVLALTAGLLDQGDRHLTAAAALCRNAGLTPYLAHTRYWHARLLRRRAGPDDLLQARALEAEGQGLATSLGLGLLGERIARLEAGGQGAPGEPSAATAPAAALPAAPAFSLRREGDYWTVTVGDQVCRIKDTRGLQLLAELCAHPGREFHVLALSGSGGEGSLGGDAGEALDAEAIAEYRARVEELDEEIAEAESFADAARASRAREERAAIAAELAAGVGLGGRARRVGGAAERARTNVQRRIRGAIKKIAESMPALGAYLDRTVRTGTFCSYQPL